MHKHLTSLTLTFALLFATPVCGLAAENIEGLQKEVSAFTGSREAIYASSTIARAQNLLQAAVQAEEAGDTEAEATQLTQAREALQEARDHASRFQEQNAALIRLRHGAQEALRALSHAQAPQAELQYSIAQADQQLAKAVSLSEQGDLNRSQQASADAAKAYKQAIDSTIGSLIEQSSLTLADAAHKGASQYTPITYEAAKRELETLQQYQRGMIAETPVHPAMALSLARKALELSLQVRAWRKHSNSHEELALQNQREHLELARILGMPINEGDAHFDVSFAELKQALINKQEAWHQQMTELKQADEQHLQQALEQQKQQLLAEANSQMGDMREAYRAKLERETFEQKRQKELRKLFEKGQTETLVNVDGTIIVRLTALKFAPGHSKFDKSYAGLMQQVQKALALYPDRSIRIEGHTDNQGDLKMNQQLSLKRAESVRDALVAAGADSSRMKALGYGEVRPIASNDFEKGREMNRRIDIVIEGPHE